MSNSLSSLADKDDAWSGREMTGLVYMAMSFAMCKPLPEYAHLGFF